MIATSATRAPAFTAQHIASCWRAALAVWDANVELSPASAYKKKTAERTGDDPIAYIDMESRQVVVNFDLLAQWGVTNTLTAVFAHEIGHHIRFPHTLALAAQLQFMERKLIPGLNQSLTNLFFDLQVNEFVGHALAPQLTEVYAASIRAQKQVPGSLFAFYLSIYEELWSLAPNQLIGPEAAQSMDKKFPGWRAEARVFAQTFYEESNPFLQFAYFCGIFMRYLEDGGQAGSGIPLASDVPTPGADDYASAMGGSPQADDAIAGAKERGWLTASEAREGVPPADPLDTLGRVLSSTPGHGSAPFMRALVERYYRRLVEQHLFEIKSKTKADQPDPFLPIGTMPWEYGDNPGLIDWTQTLIAAGQLAPVMPLQREFEPDAPVTHGDAIPPLEIYLDTSGSMPDPQQRLNAMTLAAQILATAAIRKGSRIRGIVYSWGKPLVSDWLYAEDAARDFLLNYAGGGTQFPFEIMDDFAGKDPGNLRVIVSDSDFISNVTFEKAQKLLASAIGNSHLVVALLALPGPGGKAQMKTAMKNILNLPKFRTAIIDSYNDFGRMAATLAQALFPA